MASKKKKTAKKELMHPCERDCPLFLSFTDESDKNVLCCFGSKKPRYRKAPPRSSYISCPDHPDYAPPARQLQPAAL